MSARHHRLRDLLSACALACLRPRFAGKIAAWVREQRIVLTASQNGTYRDQIIDPDRFPFVSSLIFSFFQDPDATELFLLKPVQSTATTNAFLACAWRLTEDPGNIIYIMDTREKARDKLKNEIEPMFARIPALGAMRAGSENESSGTVIQFGNSVGAFYIGGGHSAAALTSTPAAVVMLDEQARHPIIDGVSSVDRARERVTGNNARKIFVFSKPETEARFERNEKSGALHYIVEAGTVIHANYLSGNQLRACCPCPGCGVEQEIKWADIKWHHCNIALPGMPAQWDKARIARETRWECPKCGHHVHEGAEKQAMVRAGRWIPTTGADRHQSEMYPTAHPGRWSAQFSALVDIAFDSLQWGNLALRWLDSQGDPAQLRAFFNAILGLPEPSQRSQDTTLDHLRRLIPQRGESDPAPWRMRDERGDLSGHIPALSTQLDYLGMTVDCQKDHLKYRVRAHAKDGRSYLLDYGRLADLDDVPAYLDSTRFTTMDGVVCPIYKCYIDVGNRYHEVLDLCAANYPRIEGIKGDGIDARAAMGGKCWVHTTCTKSQQPINYHMIAASYWERQLYVERFQHFDPLRHRPNAPALHFPSDIGDDYLDELTKMKEVYENHKVKWVKVSQNAVNDYGDCEKYGLVMDYNLGIRHPRGATPITYQLKK